MENGIRLRSFPEILLVAKLLGVSSPKIDAFEFEFDEIKSVFNRSVYLGLYARIKAEGSVQFL